MENKSNSFKQYFTHNDRFSLSDLAEYLVQHPEFTQKALDDIRNWIYSGGHYFHNQGFFVSKRSYFQDARFLIRPTQKELEMGYLIPGHRWHPFISREKKPWEVLLVNADGSPIEQKEQALDINSLKAFHLLLGDDQIFSDQQLKSSLFGQFYAEFPHYNLKQIFGDKQTDRDLCIRCKVIDYEQAIIQIEGVEELKENAHWDRMMEEALLRVIDTFGLSLTLPEQIEWAMFLGQPELVRSPERPLACSINGNPRLDFYKIGLTTVLWKNDGSIDQKMQQCDLFSRPDKLVQDGKFILKELEKTFQNLSPFVKEAIGAVSSMSMQYMEHYNQCLESLSRQSLAPMGKESQLFLTLSQYSHCLMDSIKRMTSQPPSMEDQQLVIEILMETEGLLQQVSPFITGCRIDES